MNILAFDTTTSNCSVALLHGDKTTVLEKNAPKQQTALILPMIEEVLAIAKLTLTDLDAIAYGCGPGSFTGMRIASCVAQGIGYALDKPIIRISSINTTDLPNMETFLGLAKEKFTRGEIGGPETAIPTYLR